MTFTEWLQTLKITGRDCYGWFSIETRHGVTLQCFRTEKECREYIGGMRSRLKAAIWGWQHEYETKNSDAV
jgi:hypothetical protein